MEDLNDVTLYAGLGGAIIVSALIEVVKRALELEDTKWTRFGPLVSILLGLGWNALILSLTPGADIRWNIIIFLGIFTGLSATGLYRSQAQVRTPPTPPPEP